MKFGPSVLITLLLACSSAGAMAAWVETGNKDDDLVKEFWDPATIQKKDGHVWVYRLRNYRVAQTMDDVKFLSMKTLQEFDCRASKFRLTASLYDGAMGGGTAVYTAPAAGNWEAPAAGTINAVMMGILCK